MSRPFSTAGVGWRGHLLDRVLALGIQASAVVGPWTRRGSKDPGYGRLPANGMRIIDCVLDQASLRRAGDAISPQDGSFGLACGFLPRSGFAGGWFRPGLRVGWVVLLQQCLLPLDLFLRLSRLLGYAGCRVGEASHPGPGASKAARRKQLQNQKMQHNVQRQVLALLEALVGLLSGSQGVTGLPASLSALLQGITGASGPGSTSPKARPQRRPSLKLPLTSAPVLLLPLLGRRVLLACRDPRRRLQPALAQPLHLGRVTGTALCCPPIPDRPCVKGPYCHCSPL